ncbi:MAG TPA: YhdP family protein [Woeseiaceae bacterium]
MERSANRVVRLLRSLLKYVAYLGAAVVILLAVAVGLFRLLLPKLPAYQEEIKQWANAAIGMEVEFSGMDARWRISGPELTFYDARLATAPGAPPVLNAQEVSVGVGLLRLLLDLELVADRVMIEDARVEILERQDGGWEVQGIPVEDLPEWRLGGGADAGALVVMAEDVRVDVMLAHRGRPVTLGIENAQFRRAHGEDELDLRIALPDELGTELGVAASRRRQDGGEPGPWRLFAEGEALKLAGLASLSPGAVGLASGNANLQLWLELADRPVPQAATALFEITDARVATPSGSGEPVPGPALSAQGRAEFSRDAEGWVVAADELVLETPRGRWPKTSFTLKVREGADGAVDRVHAVASRLDFDDLPALADLLPEPWRASVADLAPSGLVRDLDVTVFDPASDARHFEGRATFERAGVAPWRDWPGVRGVSGTVRADPAGGRLEIAATNLLLNLPRWFGEPIALGEAAGTLVWRRGSDGITLLSDSVHVANADIATQSSFQLFLPADGASPVIDLQSRWSAPDVGAIEHYLPEKIMKPGLYRWLSDALVSGRVTSATTRLSGPLAAFPFDGEGTFRTDAHVEGATLRYAGSWPDVQNIDADVVIDGTRLYSVRNSAVSAGNRSADAKVEIADLRRPVLTIDAHATGTLGSLRAFARASPIDGLFGGHLSAVDVEGKGSFDLDLSYPVLDKEQYTFTTVLQSDGGTVRIEGLPAPVTDVRGAVNVTRDSIAAEALVGRFLGSPVTIELERAGPEQPERSVILRARGSVSAAALTDGLGVPFGDKLDGETSYDVEVRFPKAGLEESPPLEVLIASELDGLALDVPAPLGKPAEPARAFELDMTFPAEGRIDASGRLADAARWRLAFQRADAGWDLDRGVLAFGGAAPGEPQTRGLHVEGSTPLLDVDAWLALGKGAAGGPGFGDRIRSVDLVVDDLRIIGQHLARHRMTLDRSAFDWVVQLDGPEVAGTITVPYDFTGTRPIELAMRKLTLPGSDAAAAEGLERLTDPRSLPGLAVQADAFALGTRRFGSLSARFQRTARGLETERIETSSETFDIVGSAGWVIDESDQTGQRTWVKARFTSSDVQRTLARLDYTPGIEGESMDVSFDVSWSGGPRQEFLDSLDGNVAVRIGSGQLNDIEPGAGRVFGLMSVVALPRRLSLDFSDVFERGFGFDEITGNFRLDDGQAYTCDLSLKGPAADVGIVGRTGLNDKAYEQAAVVSANVGNTLPVVGAVVAGPQVAAALLIFSQIFKKPLQEMGQIYYGIDGSWEDPRIDAIDAQRFAAVSDMAGCLRDAS